jgi:hypothetical protein
MNFGEIKTEIYTRVEDSESAPVYYAESQVNTSVNNCYEEMSEWAGWYESQAPLSLAANTIYYDMWNAATFTGGTFLWAKRVFNSQTRRFINPGHYRDLDLNNFEWERAIGEPDIWFMRGTSWFGTFPHKTSASGTLVMDFVGMPPPLVLDADIPGFPQEFHNGLIEGSLADLYAQDREWKKAKPHWELYKASRKALKEYTNRTRIPRRPVFGENA